MAPNVITLRGPGAGLSGYCWLDATVPKPITNPTRPGTTLNGGTGTLRAATLAASKRSVNVQITPVPPNPTARVIVQVRYTDAGTRGSPSSTSPRRRTCLPPTSSDFSASTGGSNDVHLIRNAQVDTDRPAAEPPAREAGRPRSGRTPLPPVITAGTEIPYQYTVTNTGAPVTGLSITDDQIATGRSPATRRPSPRRPPWGRRRPVAGVYIVTPADVDAGRVVNVATANAVPTGGGTVISPPATVTVPLVSSISIAKAVTTPPPYSVGQQVTYSYALTNTGGSDLRGFIVSDDRIAVQADHLPGRIPRAGGIDHLQRRARDRTGRGELRRVPGQHRIRPGGDLHRTVRDGGARPGADPGGDRCRGHQVRGPNAPLVGTDVTFTITATGNGPTTATGVVVTDVVPDGDPVDTVVYRSHTTTAGTYDPATGAWAIGSLALGQTQTLTITATVNTGTPYTNTAARSRTDQPDRDPTNDAASVTINPVIPSMDIAVVKSVDRGEISLGETATFTLSATNSGPQAASGVAVRDALPPGLAFVADAPATVTPARTTLRRESGPSAPSAWARPRRARSPSAACSSAAYVNLASLTGDPTPPDSNPTNNSDSANLSVVYPVADLAIVKTAFPQTVTVGDVVTYQLQASNLGPDTALQVVVTDVFPDGVTVLSATTSTGTITADGGVWTIGTLAPGQEGVTATVTATIDDAGTLVNTATIGSPVVDDPDLSNNSSSATVTSAEPELDIAVGKSVTVPSGASPDAVPIGQQVEFTITAENIPGPTAADRDDVVLTDRAARRVSHSSRAPATACTTRPPATVDLDSIARGRPHPTRSSRSSREPTVREHRDAQLADPDRHATRRTTAPRSASSASCSPTCDHQVRQARTISRPGDQ